MTEMLEPYQPELPFIEGKPFRTVDWVNVRQECRWRAFHLGRKTVNITERNENGGLSRTVISEDQISDVKDPQLRSALRLQAAASALGTIYRGLGSSSTHFVDVLATNEGMGSRFVEADYTDTINDHGEDTFMRDLHLAEPKTT